MQLCLVWHGGVGGTGTLETRCMHPYMCVHLWGGSVGQKVDALRMLGIHSPPHL